MSLRPRPRCSRVVTSCSASSSPSKIKRAVIVGGSSGMGKAFAKAVVSRGGSVHIGGRDIEKLEEAVTQLKTLCGDAMRGAEEKSAARCSISFACIDVTNAKSVATFFDAVENDFDALVFTAAGRAPHGPFLDLPEEDTELMLQSKFWGAYRCAKAAAPMMRSGAIVFTSGVLGRRPGVNCVPLAVANGAIEALTRSLALELGPDLRVNCLSPGFMKTERFDHMDSQKREAMLANTAASLPLKRCGDPQDAGEALYFLASSPYTTGVVLDVDGGHMVRQYVDASTDPMRQAAKTSASS
ncbi:short chain dehydrogenase [Pycnococcus provasolii]